MEEAALAQSTKTRLAIAWLLAVASMLPLWIILRSVIDFTQIAPDPTTTTRCALAAAVAVSLVTASIVASFAGNGLRTRAGAVIVQLIAFVTSGALSLLTSGLALTETAQLARAWIDFSSPKSRTAIEYLPIDRAYQLHGKGRSWNIQIGPFRSTLSIAKSDYDRMSEERATGNLGMADQLQGDRRFCARVIVERAGTAARVLNAGYAKMVTSTVVRCPARKIEG